MKAQIPLRVTAANRPVRRRSRLESYNETDLPIASSSSPSLPSDTASSLNLANPKRNAHCSKPGEGWESRDFGAMLLPAVVHSQASGQCVSTGSQASRANAFGGKAGKAVSREARRKQNHSMIERRRREKMNKAFADLRAMVPGLLDGAGEQKGEFKLEVLEKTVEHMRELKDIIAAEVFRRNPTRTDYSPARSQQASQGITGNHGDETQTSNGYNQHAHSLLGVGSSQSRMQRDRLKVDSEVLRSLDGPGSVSETDEVVAGTSGMRCPTKEEMTTTIRLSVPYPRLPAAGSSGTTFSPNQAGQQTYRSTLASMGMSRSDTQATLPEEQLPLHGTMRQSFSSGSFSGGSRSTSPFQQQHHDTQLDEHKPAVVAPPLSKFFQHSVHSLPDLHHERIGLFRDAQVHVLCLPPLTTPIHPPLISHCFTTDEPGRLTIEPSPLLPPLPALQTLFGDVLMGKTEWRSACGEQTDLRPDEDWYPPARPGLSHARPQQLTPGVGMEEQEAANVLLAFSSPEVIPAEHAAAPTLSVDRWTLDRGNNVAKPRARSTPSESHEKIEGDERTDHKTAKSARDILGGYW